MPETFCTQCNTKTKLEEIEDMVGKTNFCMKCCRIEGGYTEEWRSFVNELQRYLGIQEYWKIANILSIAEDYAPEVKRID